MISRGKEKKRDSGEDGAHGIYRSVGVPDEAMLRLASEDVLFKCSSAAFPHSSSVARVDPVSAESAGGDWAKLRHRQNAEAY